MLLNPWHGTGQPQLRRYFRGFGDDSEADPQCFRCALKILGSGEITGPHLDAFSGRALVKKPCRDIHLTQGCLVSGAEMLAEDQQAPGMVAMKVAEHDLLNP